MTTSWFDVDHKGLAKLLERRGKIALIHELISNSWDADGVTLVEVVLAPKVGQPLVTIEVRDDAPEGFADLSHAWTLFAESSRKAHVQKRGRFNLGEKLVLALCTEALIVSTRGGVMFDARGRSAVRRCLPRGTEFQGIARITRGELAEILTELAKLIPPPGVTTIINGKRLIGAGPLKTVEATLATELADEEGVLKRAPRKCTVDIYEPLDGGVGMLYELGIPVVETGDRWSVSVSQKVPLNMDRDNVTPAYLRDVRTLVVNAMHDHLAAEDANAPLVNEALADAEATPEAVVKVLDLKYGEKRAIWDPSDPEANMNLTARGYTLIKGGQLTKAQWANVKLHDKTLPAGQIAPTKKAQFSPEGVDRWVPREAWTPAMHVTVEYTEVICRALLDVPVAVSILSDVTQGYAACFGDMGFVFNLGRLGHAFFEAAMTQKWENIYWPTVQLNQLILHEAAHHVEPNHLDERYHAALCRLGAKLTQLALTRPGELFLRPHARAVRGA